MPKKEGKRGCDASKSVIAKIAKKNLPVLIVAMLAISLASVAMTSAEEFKNCSCHSDIINNFKTSLHYTGAGMKGEYEKYAAKYFGINMDEYYAKWNCSKCHATTCEKCHGDEPHEVDMSKNITTCDKCHFKKQTATFMGDMPGHKEKGPSPDIHYTMGLTCSDCHKPEEVHGDGIEYECQLEAVKTKCEDCHKSPGKTVKGMTVKQYSTDINAHKIHEDKLDCIACHTGWMLTCKNCHLDTRKGTKPVSDEFYLGVRPDGKITTFVKMEATYDNRTHVGYGEWFPHTVTDEAKDCSFCHGNPEVLCEGCEGEILGKGGSFIPEETIEKVLAVEIPPASPIASPTPPPTATLQQPNSNSNANSNTNSNRNTNSNSNAFAHTTGFRAGICSDCNRSGCASCKTKTVKGKRLTNLAFFSFFLLFLMHNFYKFCEFNSP
nr:cytochrome c3 family protein [Methanophagales archaeon]